MKQDNEIRTGTGVPGRGDVVECDRIIIGCGEEGVREVGDGLSGEVPQTVAGLRRIGVSSIVY